MPFNLGITELLVLFLVGLVIFGPKKLPQLGISVAQAINNFKSALNNPPPSEEEAKSKSKELEELQEKK